MDNLNFGLAIRRISSPKRISRVAINRAVRGQRLVEKRNQRGSCGEASEPVDLKTIEAGGKESKGEASFFFVFGIGLLIYMSVLLYGQFVLGR